jgi:diaminopimelate decarboxylase
VNPDVDPHTHEYTTTGKEENKFGIDADRIAAVFDAWGDHPGVDLGRGRPRRGDGPGALGRLTA